jgi:hypothetical protein
MTDGSEFESRKGQEFSLLHVVQTGSGIHPTSRILKPGITVLAKASSNLT